MRSKEAFAYSRSTGYFCLVAANHSAPFRRVTPRRAGACHEATGMGRHDKDGLLGWWRRRRKIGANKKGDCHWVVRQTKINPVLIRQKESYLLTKLANMLRAAVRRPKRERDHEWIATINRTIEDLKRQGEQRGQRGRH